MTTYQASEADRRLSNIVRIGTIVELNAADATVTVDVGDGDPTAPLPWLTLRAGPDRTWWAPEPGEQVLVLSPSGELAQGVVLPGIYQDAHPQNGASADVHRTTYSDGSVVEYDRAAHRLTVNVGTGSVVVNCATATVNASNNVTLDTPQTNLTGNLSVAGVMNVQGNGATGATSTFQGAIQINGGDVVADNISLKGHGHIEQGDGNRTSNSVT